MPIDKSDQSCDTAIIGAGITGLCVAYSLGQGSTNRHRFDLIESSDSVGGAIQSTSRDGFLAEHGPNSLLIKDKRIAVLLDQIGLSGNSDELSAARSEATKRYIVQDGIPIAMPGNPMALLSSPLFSLRGKIRLLAEPFIGRYKASKNNEAEESFADFVRRRFGSELLASAAAPFVSGIYAGNPETLSIRHAFPRLWAIEQKHRSIILGLIARQIGIANDPQQLKPSQIVSFRSGMHALPKAIAAKLPDDSLHLGTKINSIEQENGRWNIVWADANGVQHHKNYQNLVITVPPHRLGSLPLEESIIASLQSIQEIESPPVTSLVLGFKREDVSHPLDGFGMLVKQSENSPLLGVLFSSSMFDHRAPEGHINLTCMMGGSISPHFADNDDQVVLDELQKLLGISAKPVFRHKTSWPRAIPQYSLDYQQKLDSIKVCEQANPGLHLAGNYRGGISVTDCMLNGLELGKQIIQK